MFKLRFSKMSLFYGLIVDSQLCVLHSLSSESAGKREPGCLALVSSQAWGTPLPSQPPGGVM